MTKNKYKHKQVMKLVVMTEEDVFSDKQTTEELMEIVTQAINDKRFYFELINPPRKKKEKWKVIIINWIITSKYNKKRRCIR